jgi:hypothetical protein
MQTLHQYFGSGSGEMPLPPPPPPPSHDVESGSGGGGWLDHSGGLHPGLFAHQEYDYSGLARYVLNYYCFGYKEYDHSGSRKH